MLEWYEKKLKIVEANEGNLSEDCEQLRRLCGILLAIELIGREFDSKRLV